MFVQKMLVIYLGFIYSFPQYEVFSSVTKLYHYVSGVLSRCLKQIFRHAYMTLREKSPNMEFFLVRIFLYSD